MRRRLTPLTMIASSIVACIILNVNTASASTPCSHESYTDEFTRRVSYVEPDSLRPGRVLLGLDGSRVQVQDDFAPRPGLLPWYNLVKWSEYELKHDGTATTALLYIDTDANGRSYLCRIDWNGDVGRDVKSSESERGGLGVIKRITLIYDERRNVVKAVSSELSAERGLARKRVACYYYDDANRFVAEGSRDDDSCSSSGPKNVDFFFVYSVDGVLLRKISPLKRMLGIDGKLFVSEAARITVFDQGAQPVAEYSEEGGRRYRRSLPQKHDESQYHAIKVIGSPAELDLRALIGGKTPGFWQIFSIPYGGGSGNDEIYSDRYLIASGDKPSIDPEVQQKVWETLKLPDHEVVLQAEGIFLLVPEVSDALWKVCADPGSKTRNACN